MKQIPALLAELTLTEKAALLEGVDSWYTRAIPRLGIPQLHLTDGPHGLRKVRQVSGGFAISDNEPATAFPTSAAVASSWNLDNATRIGAAIAAECVASGVQVLLAPGINIKRSPLCGRNFEYYSEDPLLSGAFGSAFVRGAQSGGAGCSVKHYAANSNEDYRFIGDSVVDERALREIYLRAFERVVKEANPLAIMCSYNRLNGICASQNKLLLTDVLRKEWGFAGLVMTDWGATCDRVAGIKAGCDLDMPGGVKHNRTAIIEAVHSGVLPPETLDLAVTRILKLIETCTVPQSGAGYVAEDHARLSCAIAQDSAVLLKNDGALPLTGQENLLVVGEMFERMRFQGAGSSLVSPATLISPKDAFDKRGVRYTYAQGYRSVYSRRDAARARSALAAASQSDTILFFGGLTDFEESEGFDRRHMRLGENQTALLESLLDTGKRVVLVLFAGAPVELPFYDKLAAVLDLYLPGQYGGEAAAALLLGETNPSGKLAESWPMRAEDASCFADYDNGPIAQYYESIYVGYRFYDKAQTRLRFPFGFGLSYTTFTYSHASVQKEDEQIIVSVDITNTGCQDGAEVVQLYVRNSESPVFKAEKELRAFAKVYQQAGSTKTVTLAFAQTDLAYWNVKRHDWVLENGAYEICLAASAADVRLTVPLQITYGEAAIAPYSEKIAAVYKRPPRRIPDCFSELLGKPIPQAMPRRPITLESPLRDLRQTLGGWILYTAIMAVIKRKYRQAKRLPDTLARDAQLMNTYFVVRMMPANAIRSLCMSSSGRLSYNTARGFVEIANGHFIRGLRACLPPIHD
jgi:beta-glucosidase